MDSWQTLLMIQMAQERYLASKLPTERDWLALWALVQDMDAYRDMLERAGIVALAGWEQG